MRYRKTIEVVRELGVREHQIGYLLRQGVIPPPQMDASGHRIWTDEDVERLRQAFADRKKGKSNTAA